MIFVVLLAFKWNLVFWKPFLEGEKKSHLQKSEQNSGFYFIFIQTVVEKVSYFLLHLTQILRSELHLFLFQVFLHPNSAPLWRKYLLFTQSYFSSFTVTKVNSAYGKCLSTLSVVRDGKMLSHSAPPGIEDDMLGKIFYLASDLFSLLLAY